MRRPPIPWRCFVETFLIRVWTPGSPDEPVSELRGVALRVISGRELVFGSGEELLSFLAEEAASPSSVHARGDGS
jgi:hypothetical protein